MAAVVQLYFMLLLPPLVARAAARLPGRLNASYRGASSPMPPDRLHLTLVHLGGFEQRVPDQVVQVARRAGAMLEALPFPVSLDLLQSRGPARELGTVELAGSGRGVLSLYRFRRSLVNTLLSAGWPQDMIRLRFYPHVTLDYRHEPVAACQVAPVDWQVTEFSLVASHHGEGRHEVLGSWSLHDPQSTLFE